MAIPDAQILPHATGAALKVVEAHQEPQSLVFYSGWFCPFTQRSWITLEEKKIPYQYKEVNPYKKEKHLLDINPKGLVPAVEYKGRCLYESLVICEFLEEAFPTYEPHLLPSNPVERAVARIWIDFQSKSFVPAFQRLLQAQTTDKQEAERKELYEVLHKFSKEIRGPYFFGENFSLVDAAIAPWIARDYVLAEHRGYNRVEVGETWSKYAALLEKRDSVVSTMSERQHLNQIHGRYLRDEAQSEAAKAIRARRAIP